MEREEIRERERVEGRGRKVRAEDKEHWGKGRGWGES